MGSSDGKTCDTAEMNSGRRVDPVSPELVEGRNPAILIRRMTLRLS